MKGAPLPDLLCADSKHRYQLRLTIIIVVSYGGHTGKTVGMDEIKGRECYIVDVPAPSSENTAYNGMRILD